jgi:hypothetical protein
MSISLALCLKGKRLGARGIDELERERSMRKKSA